MNDEVKVLDIQLIATLLYIASLVLSFFLTYNDKYKTLYNKRLFSKKLEDKYSIFNRSLVVILSLIFLYISYKNKEIAKRKGENLKPFNLQLSASELSLISSLIVLYVVITSGEYSIVASVENPNL